VIYQEDRPTYEAQVQDQMEEAAGDAPKTLDGLLKGGDTWTVDGERA
jgi:hypothetical protein